MNQQRLAQFAFVLMLLVLIALQQGTGI